MQSNNIFLMRHFETGKNLVGIHGRSSNAMITTEGYRQLNIALKYFNKRIKPQRVCFIPTPQAEASANLLATKLGVGKVELSLQPYHLGVASGISQEELMKKEMMSAQNLNLFRNRIIPASKTQIIDSEPFQSFINRVKKWWEQEGFKLCQNSIVVGTSSTILILSNLLNDSSFIDYYYQEIPNGKPMEWRLTNKEKKEWEALFPLSNFSYPEIDLFKIRSSLGYITGSRFFPSWSVKKEKCIIVPGYFSNTRNGPYGLLTRIAKATAILGYETILFDYLGFGESSNAERTVESDLFSLEAVIKKFANDEGIILICHSSGSAIGAAYGKKNNLHFSIALAPLCDIGEIYNNLFSESDRKQIDDVGFMHRRGIKITKQYLLDLSLVWNESYNSFDALIVAKDDIYAKNVSIKNSKNWKYFQVIADADHNFSPKNSSFDLIKNICNALEENESV